VRVQLQGAGSCWEAKYNSDTVVTNTAEQLKLKGPAPFTPSGGTCQIDAHCARPGGTAQCGPTAVCSNEQCVDPADGGQQCNPDIPPAPGPGLCTHDDHCAGRNGCGASAICGPSGYCGDPAAGSVAQACSGDASCPGSATTGEQMVCSGGTACVELCGTSDRCPIPTPIPAGGGVVNGDNTGGTAVLTGIGPCFNPTSSRERTFTWTPATSGTATISTCGGTSEDTVVYIIQGTDCHAAQLVCADDTCSRQSTITPTVTAGVTYTIVMDGYSGGDEGPFALTVTPAP